MKKRILVIQRMCLINDEQEDQRTIASEKMGNTTGTKQNRLWEQIEELVYINTCGCPTRSPWSATYPKSMRESDLLGMVAEISWEKERYRTECTTSRIRTKESYAKLTSSSVVRIQQDRTGEGCEVTPSNVSRFLGASVGWGGDETIR